jgi:hypothetical protein
LEQLSKERRTTVNMITALILEHDETSMLDEVKQIIEIPA